jgi:hypothetical protein
VTDRFVEQFKPHGSVILAPDGGHKKLAGARSYATQLTDSTRVLLVYDDTLFRSAKDGITVSEMGVHWRNSFEKPSFTEWSSLPVATASAKSVKIGPSAAATTAFGGADCAGVLACFINAACGAFMASMPTIVHPQNDELRAALALLLQAGGGGSAVASDPSTNVRVSFHRHSGKVVLTTVRPSPKSPEGCRLAALTEQIVGFRENPGKNGEVLVQREYAENEFDEAAHHAFLLLRALHLRPEGSAVLIERLGASR